jgi:hypothetical protein
MVGFTILGEPMARMLPPSHAVRRIRLGTYVDAGTMMIPAPIGERSETMRDHLDSSGTLFALQARTT